MLCKVIKQRQEIAENKEEKTNIFRVRPVIFSESIDVKNNKLELRADKPIIATVPSLWNTTYRLPFVTATRFCNSTQKPDPSLHETSSKYLLFNLAEILLYKSYRTLYNTWKFEIVEYNLVGLGEAIT